MTNISVYGKIFIKQIQESKIMKKSKIWLVVLIGLLLVAGVVFASCSVCDRDCSFYATRYQEPSTQISCGDSDCIVEEAIKTRSMNATVHAWCGC